MEFAHVSVLPGECMDGLNIKPDGIYVDGTTGGGGHSYLIASQLSDKGRLICIDRDDDALAAAKIRIGRQSCRVDFVKSNFMDMDHVLEMLGIEQIDGVLLDLGVSSYQLDTPERGFSYQSDAPLDMRMDRTQQLTAHTVVNTYSEQRLEVAAELSLKMGTKTPRYHHLSSILSTNQDVLYLEEMHAKPSPEDASLGYLRGAAYYEKGGRRDAE